MLMFGNELTEGVKSFRDFCMSKTTITYIHDPLQAIAYQPVCVYFCIVFIKMYVVITSLDFKYYLVEVLMS